MKYLSTLSALLFCSFFPRISPAQIVYTDIDPEYQGSGFNLDLNGDGTNDFYIGGTFVPGGSALLGGGGKVYSIIRLDYGYTFKGDPGAPRIFENGDTVGITPATLVGGQEYSRLMFEEYWNSYPSNNIGPQTQHVQPLANKYLGLAIELNGQKHYGWIKFSKVSVPNGLDWLIFKSYAFNTVPDSMIVIQDPNSGNADEETDPVYVPATSGGTPAMPGEDPVYMAYPNPVKAGQAIHISRHSDVKRLDVLNMNGNTIFTRTYGAGTKEIHFYEPGLKTGTYLMRIIYADNEEVPTVHRIVVE
ncbi:MAG: T9SS type A sorting domain-containing protein [Bacteroidia bacterium]|nr:T9SS type A sorting domain-containing protein [Bacteroidia bacterium]